MPSITYISKYKKNTGLIFSPDELIDLYFYGVSIQSKDGSELPQQTIRFYIEAAQKEIENKLKIKFKKTFIDDNVSYYRDDYMNGLPLIHTRYPVNEPLSLTGFYKKVEQINYPQSWLSSHSNSDGFYMKRISIVPTSGAVVGTSQDVILTGITTSYFGSLGRYNALPDYWQFQYITGFDYDNFPMDLINLVGLLSAIPLLAIAGDMVIGSGIASQSLSIDGLSQSVSTTASAMYSAYSARITEYRKSIDQTIKNISKIYKGVPFTVL